MHHASPARPDQMHSTWYTSRTFQKDKAPRKRGRSDASNVFRGILVEKPAAPCPRQKVGHVASRNAGKQGGHSQMHEHGSQHACEFVWSRGPPARPCQA
eukprot:6184086-Pleurochrysis_carterae.AAC.1